MIIMTSMMNWMKKVRAKMNRHLKSKLQLYINSIMRAHSRIWSSTLTHTASQTIWNNLINQFRQTSKTRLTWRLWVGRAISPWTIDIIRRGSRIPPIWVSFRRMNPTEAKCLIERVMIKCQINRKTSKSGHLKVLHRRGISSHPQ
jgi:hypothetical protein